MKANAVWAAIWVLIVGVSFGRLLFPEQPPKTPQKAASIPKPTPTPPKLVVKINPEAWAKSRALDTDVRDDQIAELEDEISELKSELEAEKLANKPERPRSRMATIRLDDGTRIEADVPGGIEPGPVYFRNEDGDRIRGWIY